MEEYFPDRRNSQSTYTEKRNWWTRLFSTKSKDSVAPAQPPDTNSNPIKDNDSIKKSSTKQAKTPKQAEQQRSQKGHLVEKETK
jgi:hypothetical protein